MTTEPPDPANSPSGFSSTRPAALGTISVMSSGPQPSLATIPAVKPSRVPPLENGSRLTADEFHRRYLAMPAGTRAELIEGVVYLMPSPVRQEQHGRPNGLLMCWMTVYAVSTPGVDWGTNSTTRLDTGNEPQPDALLRLLSRGNSSINKEGYITGAPELLAEIAASTVSIDLNDKRAAYQRNGVREYIVWRVEDSAIDFFALRNGSYVALTPDAAGVVRSEILPGLWLHVPAMLAYDGATVLKTLNEGLASPDHAAFVAKLAANG
jgi:Uma2 family endonuclease